jgi:AcrR family transcriptional regulator
MEAGTRGRNRRGQGELLRSEIIAATLRLLEELGDDQALSLRAVAREVGIAATSVYLHFEDRDQLVYAAVESFHGDLAAAVEAAENAHDDPVAALTARVFTLADRLQRHPGLFKVLHESTLNQRASMPFKQAMGEGTVTAVQRCLDAALIPPGDAHELALDLRTAVHGAVSLRVNQPGEPREPLTDQLTRFLVKLLGIPT